MRCRRSAQASTSIGGVLLMAIVMSLGIDRPAWGAVGGVWTADRCDGRGQSRVVQV